MPSGTVVSTPASGSSKPVPNAHCPSPPWAWSSASYTVSSCPMSGVLSNVEFPAVGPRTGPRREPASGGGHGGPSHVGDVVGDLVERGVAVDLVAAGGEHRVLLVGAGRGDVGGP